MGRGRYIYIQDEIDEKLQEIPNRSLLINNLLRKHFQKEDFEQMTEEELELELKKEEIRAEAEKKIKELKNGL